MKKTLLIFYLSVLTFNLSAQNYKTIYSGTTSHFSNTIANDPGKTFYNTISIDSVATVTGGDELYNFISFQDSANRSCYPANRITWIAAKVLQAAAGDEYFFTSTGDTVHLLPQAALNSTWHLYNYQNGDYIEGKVTAIGAQTFIGLNDNVKTIQLTAKNSAGNTITNILNGKELKLSENYGLVQTLGFRYFPLDTVMYHLAGIENPSAGLSNLTAREIFDFNVGDEFHVDDFYQYSASMYDHYYYIDIVLSKSFSADSDTVYYTYDHCYRNEHLNAPNYNVYTGHITITEYYVLSLPSATLNQYSWQMKDTSAATWQNVGNGFLTFYSDTTYLGRLKKTEHYYYSPSGFQPCFELCLCDPPPPDITYAPGLGWIGEDGWGYSYGSLVYYKKGTEEWGHPLSCSILLSTDNVSNNKTALAVYPNPVFCKSEITFTYPGLSGQNEIVINDINGKEIMRYSLPEGSSLQHVKLPEMHAGIYVARLMGSGVEGNVKFVVQ